MTEAKLYNVKLTGREVELLNNVIGSAWFLGDKINTEERDLLWSKMPEVEKDEQGGKHGQD